MATKCFSKPGVAKNDKVAGAGSGRVATYLYPSKAKPFYTLFDRIKERFDTLEEAKDFIKIGWGLFYSIDDRDKISSVTAKKILDAYNKLEKQGVENDDD